MGAFDYRQAEEVRQAFGRHGVRYLFIGKSGAILLGFPDTTQDADVFVEKTPENGRANRRRPAGAGLCPRRRTGAAAAGFLGGGGGTLRLTAPRCRGGNQIPHLESVFSVWGRIPDGTSRGAMEEGQFERLLVEIGESRRHTDEVAGRLAGEIAESRRHTDEVAGRLAGEIAESRRHTDEVAGGLAGEIAESRRHTDTTAEGLRAEIRQTAEETRREFHVVAEDLRTQVQLVAEGVATVDAKVERLRTETRADSAETRALLRLSYSGLDRRVAKLEGERRPEG